MGDESVKTALHDLYASVVKWDVASHGQIRNMEELDRLMAYLMHNIGSPMSMHNMANGMGANRELVDRHINLMREAFILYRADRYDVPSSSLNPSPKYYVVDPGLRDMAIWLTQRGPRRMLENIVYLELLRRGRVVQVGKYGAKEIYFIATSNIDGREYYQVCLSMTNEATTRRS